MDEIRVVRVRRSRKVGRMRLDDDVMFWGFGF